MSSQNTQQVTEKSLQHWALAAPDDSPVRFVVVYAAWCSRCQALQSRLQKMFAGKPMTENGFPDIPTAKFIEQRQAQSLQILGGFPTVRKYVQGIERVSEQEALCAFLGKKYHV
jgi:hypothetical protein